MGMHNPPSPIRIPRMVICDQCGNPFETVTDEKTCTQCMIKPSRRPTDFPPIPKEMSMPQNCKIKECVDCHKKYTPTSNVQKRCPECMDVHKKQYHYRIVDAAPKNRVHEAKQLPVARTGLNVAGFLRNLSDNGVTGIVFGDIKISIDKA